MRTFKAHKQHKQRRSFSGLWLVLLTPVILLLVGVSIAYGLYKQNLQPLSDSTESVIVIIPVGTTATGVGELLESKGVIRSGWFFDVYTRLSSSRDNIKAGGYKLSPAQSVQEIVSKLTSGEIATDLVTILPAQRIDQIKTAFIKAGYTNEEVNRALSESRYTDHPIMKYKPESATLEGYLYPESFLRNPTTSLEDIIRASLDETHEMITSQLRSDLSAQNLTVHQAIILASIVEREVNNDTDRTKVAQVFLKRLREDISLGSDPTALYGALVSGVEPSVFADTPYNTRLYPGLPPGPINNVSIESLRAVAYPADTDFLFFVSGDDGNTYFSNTLEEHERLTAQHCKELCSSY